MSERRQEFTHFKPEATLIPTTERGGVVEEGTEFVVGPDGKIACVGTSEDVAAWVRGRRDEGLEVEIEQGGVVLPGLTDTHYHPALFSSISVSDPVDVGRADSPKTFARMTREALGTRNLRPDQPLLVMNFDSGRVGKLEEIALDDVESERPLFVIDRSFHSGAANRRGTALLHEYTKKTYGGRSFPGRFRGDQFSEAHVITALELAESFQDVAAVQEEMTKTIDGYLARGVTAMHELDVPTWNEFMAYMLMRKDWEKTHEGVEFPVRRIFLDERLMGRLVKERDNLVRSGLFDNEFQGMLGVKFFADGAFGSETALMSEAYHGSHKCGISVTRMQEAEVAMRQLLKLGLNKVATHAIGDKGIERAFKFANRWRSIAEKGGVKPEFRFDHFELPLHGAVQRAGELNAWASIQSNFALEDQVYADRLGGRSRLLCPHADLTNEGVPMMLGSDGMPASMLYVIWSAMHHPDPRQRLDLISAVTAASAAAGAYEHGDLRGVLVPGAKTEIVVANPQILQAFADGRRADDYIAEALKPRGERGTMPDVRGQIAELEGNILKVFASGQKVFDATTRAA